ncbi:MAG: membrane protein [Candidatus Xenobia bacterium]
MFWDPTIMLLIPGLLLSLWASFKVRGTFANYARVPARSGLSGAEAAAALAASRGLRVGIEPSPGGTLSDHFDPTTNTLRLSPEVYSGRSLAALGVAAHEMGHALQKADGYAPLALRSGLVPFAGLGSNLAFVLLLAGMLLSMKPLLYAGIAFFSLAVLFSLVTLPVEFDASARALRMLAADGLIGRDELPGVRSVLNAAAWTYVAAAVVAVLELLRLILIARGSEE